MNMHWLGKLGPGTENGSSPPRTPRAALILLMTLALVPLSGGGVTASGGEDDGGRGREIAAESDLRDTGWRSQTASVRMILRNSRGQESTREMRNKLLEVDGDGDKLLVTFDQPRDVKGTSFLTFTHQDGPDDQWLFLPALKRVKRISSNNKSGPFMGSEFSYEDLASQELAKYTYRYLRDETINGRPAFVVERIPVESKSGYTKQIVWFDQAEYRPEQIEFYDRKQELLKTLTYGGYRQYLDQYWRPDEMSMENHQTGKSTRLLWEAYTFDADLSDRDFDRNSLQRAR
jgi:hypothetical protein